MLVKDLYYVKLKMSRQLKMTVEKIRTNLRCSLQRALSDICRYLCEVLFWAQGSFLIQMQEKVFGKFFGLTSGSFISKFQGTYCCIQRDFTTRETKKQQLYLQLYKSFSQNILTFCIQVKTYVTIPIQGMCFKQLLVCYFILFG